ncbi:alpha/beta hydrolase [Bacteriovorax sp. PP10]|uniref:Alpha/beta hydrolase n=1 Tax=Bacteriovorax antarcticus TaxID=3088717 RepID=A0ABU5VWB2_9BACT|nr:alpha/beta hydrolase [Bacteriovorax sp. PP10]MEA9357336.1 alpha/beta hydrolase [Bacteriovorax sp. PP10]
MKPAMNYIQMGKGKPLLLIHGLGGSFQSWNPIATALASHRKVIAIDLPGSGETPPSEGEVSFSALCNDVTTFIMTHNLQGIDVVGSSMGARLALELSRRGGIVGSVVALDPGGFWNTFEKIIFYVSMNISILMVRLFHSKIDKISQSHFLKKLFLSQFSYAPANLAPETVQHELRDFVKAKTFDKLLFSLTFGKPQQGMNRKQEFPITIVWGKQDRVCFKNQAKRAMKLFPKAHLVWLEKCGHFPQWDRPTATVEIILAATVQNEESINSIILPSQRPGQETFVVNH